MMGYYVCVMIFTASLSSWVICLLRKVGFIEWVQVHGNDFFHKLFSCDFCLSWWCNVAVCSLASIVLREWWVLLLPFVNTNITKKLL